MGGAEAARRLATKLVDGELPTPFSCWQVWRSGWSGLSERQTAQAAIDILVELNWLTEEVLPTAGRNKTLYHLKFPKHGRPTVACPRAAPPMRY